MKLKKDEVRNKILLAAKQEFFTHGYLDANMRSIADIAGITPGNIYRYYSSKEELLGKKFKFYVDLQTEEEQDDSSESSSDEGKSSYEELIDLIYDLFGDGSSVDGYYRTGDKLQNSDIVMHFGFELNEDVKEAIAKTLEVETFDFDIKPEVTEKFMYSVLSGDTLNLTIPVSSVDFVLQLYWYGYDIYFDSTLHFEELEETHDVGSHPTSEDVTRINNSETYKKHHTSSFRDYHALTIGLIKE